MNDELLQALENAYANGYDLNWAKQFAANNGAGDLVPQIEEFYKKKKRTWYRTWAIRFRRFTFRISISSVG
jgi:hypothetical protein